MAITPLMMRAAPSLGMIDRPDPRKIHANPVPRVGGIGIVVGSLVSIWLWLPVSQTILTYLFGSLVLLLFGAWDDCRQLGHYVKFVGQFIAAIAVVYVGDVWVVSFPFVVNDLPESVGRPFTVFAIVGMINAINHSDGLDGLAGGESLLSLGCIAYLAHNAEGPVVMSIAVAIIGGLLGFLRFNTHPARVFMGDSGSQFLGFSLAVLTVLLTQHVDGSLSMAIPALILGLPIIDILAVLAQRIYHRMNWFRATKNHIHHRLLGLGYDHYQAVLIIYSIQAFFVVVAVWMRHESDLLVMSLYVGVCTIVFVLLVHAQYRGWHFGKRGAQSALAELIEKLRANKVFIRGPTLVVAASLSIYFVLGSLSVQHISQDFGIAAAAFVAALLLGVLWHRFALSTYLLRLASYGTAAFLAYLIQKYAADASPIFSKLEVVFFGVLAIAIALAVRYGADVQFRTTPMDYMIIFMIISAGLLGDAFRESSAAFLVIKLVILFYGSELILTLRERRLNTVLDLSVMTSSAVLAFKSFMFT